MAKKRRSLVAATNPGSSPGTLTIPEGAPPPRIRVTRYSPEHYEARDNVAIAELPRALEGDGMVWIEIEGYGDRALFEVLEKRFAVPRLALEDVLSGAARPKAEIFGAALFVVARAAKFASHEFEQLSAFARERLLITFVDEPLDVLKPLRERVQDPASRTRHSAFDFLLYRVLDCVVDTYVPSLDNLGARLDALEADAIANPSSKPLRTLYELMRDVRQFRRVALPMRDMVSSLRHEAPTFFAESTYPFLSDLRDHTNGVVELVGHYHDVGADVRELINGALNLKLNEAMRVLAALTAVFGPLTLITGIYGMNFVHMPELQWHLGYPLVLLALVGIAACILLWMRKRGWTRTNDD